MSVLPQRAAVFAFVVPWGIGLVVNVWATPMAAFRGPMGFLRGLQGRRLRLVQAALAR